jgi:hypothetical protein
VYIAEVSAQTHNPVIELKSELVGQVAHTPLFSNIIPKVLHTHKFVELIQVKFELVHVHMVPNTFDVDPVTQALQVPLAL